MYRDLAAFESLFLGLADKTRLRLLGLMAEKPVPVADLVAETGENQPKISRHLAYLRNAGLVDTTRDGKWIYYGVATLADTAADSVFRCVLEELSGNSLQDRAAPITRRPVLQPDVVTSDHQYASDEYLQDEESFQTVASEAWGHPSDERRDELEVFML